MSFFSAFINSFKIPELRSRIIFTFGIILVCRLLAWIPAPGVDLAVLKQALGNVGGAAGQLLDMFSLFTGGALEQFGVGSLGIMPYISASIIIQLMSAVVPSLERLKREGEAGQAKISQYTKYLTLFICVVQGWFMVSAFQHSERFQLPAGVDIVVNPGFMFVFIAVLTLTAGAMLLVWLGDQITDRGIGNGVSIIITLGIIAQLPSAIAVGKGMFFGQSATFSVFHLAALLVLFFLVTAACIMLTMGQRRITVQYAKRQVGRQQYGGGTQYMPLRVNYSGVMPLIFAQAIMTFPSIFLAFTGSSAPWVSTLQNMFDPSQAGIFYILLYTAMIMFFSYFWVATQFNPIQVADDLKKSGGYVPGIRPGKPTAEFMDRTMTRITLAGSIGLTVLALFPILLTAKFGIPFIIANFFGGTSLLIIVGVLLDTMRQIETHLLNRNYDGFLRKGKMRGR